jgi:hypothetical protein
MGVGRATGLAELSLVDDQGTGSGLVGGDCCHASGGAAAYDKNIGAKRIGD